jgi:hypothetical protein
MVVVLLGVFASRFSDRFQRSFGAIERGLCAAMIAWFAVFAVASV